MKQVHVAVAVIENRAGDVLIARRADHQHMGGLWELPGGKVEAGETVFAALAREIREEMALDVQAAEPLLQIPFHYPDKHVLLDVWRVTQFAGEASGCEGQPVLWVPRAQLSQYEFPPANRAILTALQLPERLLITGPFIHADECLLRVERALQQHQLCGVMLRAHHLSADEYRVLATRMLSLCRAQGAQLLLNTAPETFLTGADGLHLTAQRLMICRERPVAADVLLGASCHNRDEIEHALAIGVDYITLSPVLPTVSHPGEVALGWSGWRELLQHCPVPVYALGGVSEADVPQVKQLGGFGVAAISAWWS